MQTSLGIIEGFYGKLYSKEARNSLLSFASNHGFSYYIYAPKNDKELRRNWKDNFSKEKIAYLKEFSSFCHKQNMAFGIGISPLEISNEVDASLPILLNKIDIAINEFKTDIIAILFDDIKLYTSDEGIKQNFIVNQIFEHIKDKDIRLIFCPTYYSFDPILDKVFGKCPENYFEQIDRKSTRLNSSHQIISYAVFCLKKQKESHQWDKEQRNDRITTNCRLHMWA